MCDAERILKEGDSLDNVKTFINKRTKIIQMVFDLKDPFSIRLISYEI